MNKIKFYFWCGLSHTLYFLGDLVSKPMSWGWCDNEHPITEWICGINYNIYNWLMLKSSDIDDKGQYGVWDVAESDK